MRLDSYFPSVWIRSSLKLLRFQMRGTYISEISNKCHIFGHCASIESFDPGQALQEFMYMDNALAELFYGLFAAAEAFHTQFSCETEH